MEIFSFFDSFFINKIVLEIIQHFFHFDLLPFQLIFFLTAGKRKFIKRFSETLKMIGSFPSIFNSLCFVVILAEAEWSYLLFGSCGIRNASSLSLRRKRFLLVLQPIIRLLQLNQYRLQKSLSFFWAHRQILWGFSKLLFMKFEFCLNLSKVSCQVRVKIPQIFLPNCDELPDGVSWKNGNSNILRLKHIINVYDLFALNKIPANAHIEPLILSIKRPLIKVTNILSIMDYFRHKLMTYSTEKQMSTLLHIHVEIDRPKFIIPPTSCKNYIDDLINQNTVPMHNYPDLSEGDKNLSWMIYQNRSKRAPIFIVEEVKKRLSKKRSVVKKISQVASDQYRSCQCCGAKVFIKHRCEHTYCQKPCSRMKKPKTIVENEEARSAIEKKDQKQEEEEDFLPSKQESQGDSQYSRGNESEYDEQAFSDVGLESPSSEDFLSSTKKKKIQKKRHRRNFNKNEKSSRRGSIKQTRNQIKNQMQKRRSIVSEEAYRLPKVESGKVLHKSFDEHHQALNITDPKALELLKNRLSSLLQSKNMEEEAVVKVAQNEEGNVEKAAVVKKKKKPAQRQRKAKSKKQDLRDESYNCQSVVDFTESPKRETRKKKSVRLEGLMLQQSQSMNVQTPLISYDYKSSQYDSEVHENAKVVLPLSNYCTIHELMARPVFAYYIHKDENQQKQVPIEEEEEKQEQKQKECPQEDKGEMKKGEMQEEQEQRLVEQNVEEVGEQMQKEKKKTSDQKQKQVNKMKRNSEVDMSKIENSQELMDFESEPEQQNPEVSPHSLLSHMSEEEQKELDEVAVEQGISQQQVQNEEIQAQPMQEKVKNNLWDEVLNGNEENFLQESEEMEIFDEQFDKS